ncbi:hypothetical protein [Metapseudomonas otitidis]|uniref:hypothetical protein n=1 Tax=Metapseudomonas otitidis TaxID=319939 RepID=UPI002446D886|nr:hypothetical protein [Pseudomonas otitidis]MDH0335173.1 hypothetical protein [Pseudomonas otitidis]
MKWGPHTFSAGMEARSSKNAIESEEGYVITRYTTESGDVFIARAPDKSILHSGFDADQAKSACEDHLKAQQVAA